MIANLSLVALAGPRAARFVPLAGHQRSRTPEVQRIHRNPHSAPVRTAQLRTAPTVTGSTSLTSTV